MSACLPRWSLSGVCPAQPCWENLSGRTCARSPASAGVWFLCDRSLTPDAISICGRGSFLCFSLCLSHSAISNVLIQVLAIHILATWRPAPGTGPMASSIAASASSRLPRSASRTTGCSATWPGPGRTRRGGRSASSRYRAVASSIAASASSRRPGLPARFEQVVQRHGQVRAEHVGAGGGQLPVQAVASSIAASASSRRPGLPAGSTGCSATWPGPGRTRRGGRWPAPGTGRSLPRSRPARLPAAPAHPAGPTGCSASPARRLAASGPSSRLARSWITCWLVRVAASAASRTLCSGIWAASAAACPGCGASVSASAAMSARSA